MGCSGFSLDVKHHHLNVSDFHRHPLTKQWKYHLTASDLTCKISRIATDVEFPHVLSTPSCLLLTNQVTHSFSKFRLFQWPLQEVFLNGGTYQIDHIGPDQEGLVSSRLSGDIPRKYGTFWSQVCALRPENLAEVPLPGRRDVETADGWRIFLGTGGILP